MIRFYQIIFLLGLAVVLTMPVCVGLVGLICGR